MRPSSVATGALSLVQLITGVGTPVISQSILIGRRWVTKSSVIVRLPVIFGATFKQQQHTGDMVLVSTSCSRDRLETSEGLVSDR